MLSCRACLYPVVLLVTCIIIGCYDDIVRTIECSGQRSGSYATRSRVRRVAGMDNGRVGVTTERQQRNERAPPFGLDALKQASSSQVRVIPAGAIGFHRA